MRGDASLSLRLLTGPSGRSGGLVALGGVTTAVASALPWYAVVATVGMLDHQRSRTVSLVRGVPDVGFAVTTLAIGLVLIAMGIAIGIDRPRPASPLWLGLACLTAAVLAVAALGRTPSIDRLASPTSRELQALREELPTGIDLTLSVQTRLGPWLVLAGVALAVVGALSHGRDERAGDTP